MNKDILQTQIAELCETFELAELAKVRVGTIGDNTLQFNRGKLIWQYNHEQHSFSCMDDFVFAICKKELVEKVYEKTRNKLAKNPRISTLVETSCIPNDLLWNIARRADAEVAFTEDKNVRELKREIVIFIKKYKMNNGLSKAISASSYTTIGERLQTWGLLLTPLLVITLLLSVHVFKLPRNVIHSLIIASYLTGWFSAILKGGDLYDQYKFGGFKLNVRHVSAFLCFVYLISWIVMILWGTGPLFAYHIWLYCVPAHFYFFRNL